jgi:O-antigen/teichoic acid export membrane protein
VNGVRGILAANIGARVGALVALALATLLVARTGGPEAVGIYTLARVLPGLVGVVASAGLPGALAYFLAGRDGRDPRLPSTIVAMAVAGGLLGALAWSAMSPLLGGVMFPGLAMPLVLLTGATVFTQLLVATSKSCSQGTEDLPGSNRVIVNEEAMFLPAYGLLWLLGVDGLAAAITGLLLADVAAFALGWARLARRGFFARAGRPSPVLARQMASYGLRAQLGGVIVLLNLRLDFILLSLLTGPAVLGIYAVASKFAELIKIPGQALTYVLYPRYARDGHDRATAEARRIIPRAAMATTAAVLPLAVAAGLVIPLAYGHDFAPAVVPAQIILMGLLLEGVTGVVTGYLYGVGRPGLNSWAMAGGLVLTVALDLLLIPPFGVEGAAVASAIAYMGTTLALLAFFVHVSRADRVTDWMPRTEGSRV